MNKYINKIVKNKDHIQLAIAIEDKDERSIKVYDNNANASDYNMERYEIGS